MSESGPRWMKVATPPVTARVGQLAQNGISTCLVFSRSIARTTEARFSLDLVATRLPQLDVASFRLHLLSLLDVAASITCHTIVTWELPGDGPFLFPIDAQARLGLIKDMAKSRIVIENKPGFYLRMYKDTKTGLMLVNVADFDLLNDQALTPQLLRASKPMYALAATIPPPTCITGGATASGAHVDILRSLVPFPPGNHTFRFTHVAIGLDVVDEYPDTDGHFRRCISERHCGRTRDFSLGDREDRQMLVKTLRRRFPVEVHQTNIVLIDCRAFRDPASSALRNHWGVHPTTLSKILNHHKFPGLLLDLVERVMRFADKDPKTRILIGFICMKARHRSVACSYLMQVIYTALNYSVNTRTTAIASRGRHL